MKSVQISGYGSGDVIRINEISPLPSPSTGKILAEVIAAGVNPADWKVSEGYFREMMPLQFPSTLGIDFAGIIKQIGEDVSSDFSQGDEVYGQASIFSGGSGAFAELALASKDSIAHKPRTLNYFQAAALPTVGVSAWQALVEHIGVSNGQKILIHGGAGGIGSIAIQLAKHLGASVATTVSPNDKQYTQELGADQVIDYKNQSFEEMLHDYDAVFDTVGGQTYLRSFKVLKKGGIIVSMLEQPNSELMNQYGVRAIFLFSQVNRERLTKLVQWVDQNNVKVNVDKIFSLNEASKALEYQKDVHPRGKVVLTV
jgi:alcohol dehydrogenase